VIFMVRVNTPNGGVVERWLRDDFRAGLFRTRKDAERRQRGDSGRRYEGLRAWRGGT
jgi:hypothetical protein